MSYDFGYLRDSLDISFKGSILSLDRKKPYSIQIRKIDLVVRDKNVWPGLFLYLNSKGDVQK